MLFSGEIRQVLRNAGANEHGSRSGQCVNVGRSMTISVDPDAYQSASRVFGDQFTSGVVDLLSTLHLRSQILGDARGVMRRAPRLPIRTTKRLFVLGRRWVNLLMRGRRSRCSCRNQGLIVPALVHHPTWIVTILLILGRTSRRHRSVSRWPASMAEAYVKFLLDGNEPLSHLVGSGPTGILPSCGR